MKPWWKHPAAVVGILGSVFSCCCVGPTLLLILTPTPPLQPPVAAPSQPASAPSGPLPPVLTTDAGDSGFDASVAETTQPNPGAPALAAAITNTAAAEPFRIYREHCQRYVRRIRRTSSAGGRWLSIHRDAVRDVNVALAEFVLHARGEVVHDRDTGRGGTWLEGSFDFDTPDGRKHIGISVPRSGSAAIDALAALPLGGPTCADVEIRGGVLGGLPLPLRVVELSQTAEEVCANDTLGFGGFGRIHDISVRFCSR